MNKKKRAVDNENWIMTLAGVWAKRKQEQELCGTIVKKKVLASCHRIRTGKKNIDFFKPEYLLVGATYFLQSQHAKHLLYACS